MTAKTMRRHAATLAATAVSAPLLALGAAAPASAAVDSAVCVSWGCGSINFTFRSATVLNPLHLKVRDTSCDGRTAKIRVEMVYADGPDANSHFTPFTLANGCGDAAVIRTTSWTARYPILRARASLESRFRAPQVGPWRFNPLL